MRSIKWSVASGFALLNAVVFGMASGPIAACQCGATCSSVVGLSIHGVHTSVLGGGTITAIFDGTTVVAELSGTGPTTGCNLAASPSSLANEGDECRYDGETVSLDLVLASTYDKAESELDLTVDSDVGRTQIRMPVGMREVVVCGLSCFEPASEPELWIPAAT